MKSISSAIVVLAGSLVFVGGAFHQHPDTQMVVCGVGLLVGIAGLVGWVRAMTAGD